jgi:S1-C subfamily serine protease
MRISAAIFGSVFAVVISQVALAASTGSGFAVNPTGYIITNNHVVTRTGTSSDGSVFSQECQRLDVKGDPYSGAATVVGRDFVNDLALIPTSINQNP